MAIGQCLPLQASSQIFSSAFRDDKQRLVHTPAGPVSAAESKPNSNTPSNQTIEPHSNLNSHNRNHHLPSHKHKHITQSTIQQFCSWSFRLFTLLRLPFHLNFAIVILGYLLGGGALNLSALQLIFHCYLSFCLLLYTGIYSFNGYADYDEDKKSKPWRTQAYSKEQYLFCTFLFWALGLSSSAVVGHLNKIDSYSLFLIYLSFVVFNLIYSLSKRFSNSALFESFFSALTAPMRFNFGIFLATGNPFNHSWPVLLLHLFVYFYMASFHLHRKVGGEKIMLWIGTSLSFLFVTLISACPAWFILFGMTSIAVTHSTILVDIRKAFV